VCAFWWVSISKRVFGGARAQLMHNCTLRLRNQHSADFRRVLSRQAHPRSVFFFVFLACNSNNNCSPSHLQRNLANNSHTHTHTHTHAHTLTPNAQSQSHIALSKHIQGIHSIRTHFRLLSLARRRLLFLSLFLSLFLFQHQHQHQHQHCLDASAH
jgi:hypothetical protein